MILKVKENLLDLGSVLPESFARMAVKRLSNLGCPVTNEEEAWGFAYEIRQAELDILNYCHIDIIPSTLYLMLCDRACGKYLYVRKQSGKLEIADLDLTGALTSLKEGDVSISFASGGSDAERLEALLKLMMDAGRGELACYRKIKW